MYIGLVEWEDDHKHHEELAATGIKTYIFFIKNVKRKTYIVRSTSSIVIFP